VVLFELRGTRGAGDPGTDPQDGVTRTFTENVQQQTGGAWTAASPQGDILADPVNYKAVSFLGNGFHNPLDYVTGAYVKSEQDGIVKLRQAIAGIRTKYKNARIAFVGYSSGAQVVRTVIAGMTSAEQNRVAFAVTYGDPLFMSGQSFDRGHWIPGKTGVYWAARAFNRKLPDPGFTPVSIRQGHAGMTAGLASRTEDWVKFEDPIAQYPSIAIWQHFLYAPKDKAGPYITQGAKFAAGMVR
jgi:hypothetical protein